MYDQRYKDKITITNAKIEIFKSESSFPFLQDENSQNCE